MIYTGSELVSVILPVYNAENYLAGSIRSILEQSYENLQLIIVNDGSTDESDGIIKSFKDKRIKLIEQENMGLSRTLIQGIKASDGKYIARLDADDIACGDRLKKQMDFLISHEDHVLVGGNADIIDLEGNYLYTSNQPRDWDEINRRMPHNSFIHSTVMFRHEAYESAGGYAKELTRLIGFEDVALWNRMALYGKMCNLPEVLIKYRLWPYSGSFYSGKENATRVAILNKYLQGNQLTPEDEKIVLNLKQGIKRDKLLGRYYAVLMKKKLLYGKRSGIFKYFVRSVTHNPTFAVPYLYLLASALPDKLLKGFIKLIK